MASLHVPVHDRSVSDEAFEDDLFDDGLELTFPPSRYYHASQGTPPQKLRRDSSRERERLYRELVGHAPYQGRQQIEEEGAFCMALDVKHYKPEEISIKVEERQLIVTGKHYNTTTNGFDKSEFLRKYTIPDKVDLHTLTSSITPGGTLCIKAIEAHDLKNGNKPSDSDKFTLSLDVHGYRPDEISIRVHGHQLIICGETKNENPNAGGTFHHQQFTRKFSLPFDLNMESLSSRYTKDEKLTIEAPRGLCAPMRELEIKKD